MTTVLTYWYLKSPAWFYNACLECINSLENSLAVRATARNITKPLFQDYTYQGRIIGVLIRSARITLGFFVYILVVLVFVASFLFWISLPFLCLASLVGGFIAPSGEASL